MVAVQPFTAREYAGIGKIDPATFFGMREAMAAAVLDLKGQDIAPDQYAERAKAALDKAVENNPLLKAAGTQELVRHYFHDVVDRQGGDANAHVRAFLEGITVDARTIENARNGRLSDEQLATLGGTFLKSAKKNLGIQTLTEDFQATIKKDGINEGVAMVPQVLSEEQVTRLAQMESSFRLADKLDATFFGNPAVNHLMAHTDGTVEKALNPVIEAAERLRRGENAELAAKDVALIKSALTGKEEPPVTLTEEEYKNIGQQTLNIVARMRAGDTTATSGSLLEIINNRGNASNAQRPAEERNPFDRTDGKGNDNPLLALISAIFGGQDQSFIASLMGAVDSIGRMGPDKLAAALAANNSQNPAVAVASGDPNHGLNNLVSVDLQRSRNSTQLG